MLGVRVSVPVASFRKGLAREYLETEPLPPPATCYGFLLSLVGEVSRNRHIGCRVCPVLLNEPEMSVVLRTLWRVKSRPLGATGNTRPDFQQLLCPIELAIWVDSSEEIAPGPDQLEVRVEIALREPHRIDRFGGLSLGESSHLVDVVERLPPTQDRQGRAFVSRDNGRMTLPVWVDHVGSSGTRYVTGDLVLGPVVPPPLNLMPRIEPPGSAP